MLVSTMLKGPVQASLEQLLKGGHHQETLWLVKRLQFTPEFDQLHWTKQLLQRADTATRHLAYSYLRSQLIRMGNGVYEALTRIATWLPPPERSLGTYSQFDFLVLRLLIQYSLETVQRFKAEHYGD